jgi:hypothetical protein
MRRGGGWHIVAHGYLCKVTDEKEGRLVIAVVQTSTNEGSRVVDMPRPDSYTPRQSCLEPFGPPQRQMTMSM